MDRVHWPKMHNQFWVLPKDCIMDDDMHKESEGESESESKSESENKERARARERE